jgi:hypothetical protein
MKLYVMQPEMTPGDPNHVAKQNANAAALFSAAGISGVMLHGTLWKDVAPAPGVYDFSGLDETLALIPGGHGLTLVLTAGLNCPAWLVSQAGVPAVDVDVNVKVGGAATRVAVPVPWDSRFQAAYVAAVAEMVGHIQAKYPALTITGFVASLFHGIDCEMTIPWMVNNKPQTQNAQAWADAGYLPDAVQSAWFGFLQAVAAVLPPDCILEIAPLGTKTTLPWVDNNGDVLDAGGEAGEGLLLGYYSGAAELFGARVRAQFVSLSTVGIPSFFMDAVAEGCVLGVQTNTWGGQFCSGTHTDPVPGTAATFQLALEQAAAAGAAYGELHDSDVTAWPDVVAAIGAA